MKYPRFSIITPVFNSDKTINKTLESIKECKHKYPNLQYIVVDGQSQDNTLAILESYRNVIDYLISEKDDGLYFAINKGLDVIDGDWVLILGSDDILIPDALSKISSYFTDRDVAYYGNVVFSSNGKVFDGEFSQYKTMYYNISHQSIFYPASYCINNKYDTQFRIAADFEYLKRFIRISKFRLKYIPELISIYEDKTGISSLNEDHYFYSKKLSLIYKNYPFYLFLLFFIRYGLVYILTKLGLKSILKNLLNK